MEKNGGLLYRNAMSGIMLMFTNYQGFSFSGNFLDGMDFIINMKSRHKAAKSLCRKLMWYLTVQDCFFIILFLYLVSPKYNACFVFVVLSS